MCLTSTRGSSVRLLVVVLAATVLVSPFGLVAPRADGDPKTRTVHVKDDAQLRAAFADLRAGDTVLLAKGNYRGGHLLADAAGSPKAPIVIAAADPKQRPVFNTGTEALHLTRPRNLTLRNLVVRGRPGNGINIDEGGVGKGVAAHVTIDGLLFEKIGPTGNHDALKLSGLTDFIVKDCTFVGWGGSAIDMVGCRRGLIQGCTLRGTDDCSQHSGIQAKGGTAKIVIRACRFEAAGARAVNLGGSTGLPYFRPPDAPYEAQDLTVEGCRFRDSETFVAFVGVDGASVRRNTFYRPRRWVLRILQESTAKRFVPCRNGRFEHNLVVFRKSELHRFVNVGANTQPKTFTFTGNAWFATDAKTPSDHRPSLPTAETEGRYGLDPKLDVNTLALAPDSSCRKHGADSRPNK